MNKYILRIMAAPFFTLGKGVLATEGERVHAVALGWNWEASEGTCDFSQVGRQVNRLIKIFKNQSSSEKRLVTLITKRNETLVGSP